jgi:hypothetical protein
VLALWGCNAQLTDLSEDYADGGEADGGVPDFDTGPRRLVRLQVLPDNEVLLVDLRQEATRDFTVTGLYSDGTKEDLTGKAMLALDNPTTGRLMGTRFHSAVQMTNRVDFTRVTATYKPESQTITGVANLTIVWLRQSGPSQDFFFTLPYMAASQKKPLSFTTLIQSIDAFFAVDTTASMTPSITELRDKLQNTIIPGVKAAAVKDAWFGVGAVEDFPVSPFGQPNYRAGMPDDQPFILVQAMTADVNAARNAVSALLFGASQTRGNGGDWPEGQIEALYQIATGEGNVRAGVVNVPPHKVKIGGVEFRPGALPVVTLISDAIFHTKGEGRTCTATTTMGAPVTLQADYTGTVAAVAHTRAEAAAALNKICAKVIGISTLRTMMTGIRTDPNGICPATSDLIGYARDTGALVPPEAWDLPMRPAGCAAGRCCTGVNGAGENPDGSGRCPLVFKTLDNAAGLSVQITSGITQLARFATFDVVTQKSGVATGDKGEMLPMGRTTADFIKAITPLDAMPPPPPPAIKAPVISGDKFTGVTPGSVVRFTIEARNDFQRATQSPQVFHATIKILAGGCADLDQRDVIILIPPEAPSLG